MLYKCNTILTLFLQWWNRLEELKIPLDYANLEESIFFDFHSNEDIFSVLILFGDSKLLHLQGVKITKTYSYTL